MNPCGVRSPPASGDGALLGRSKERPGGLARWKAPRARKRGGIDVLPRERVQATGNEALRRPGLCRWRKVSEGSHRRSCRQPRKLRRSKTTRLRASGCRWARSRRRAVKRGAAGGRMTARWSGACPGHMAESLCARWVSMSNVGGFPTAVGGQSPDVVFSTWVLVTRNVGCRNGIEASWRRDRGKPQGLTRARRRATEKVSGL
jgi:hypothetical protein